MLRTASKCAVSKSSCDLPLTVKRRRDGVSKHSGFSVPPALRRFILACAIRPSGLMCWSLTSSRISRAYGAPRMFGLDDSPPSHTRPGCCATWFRPYHYPFHFTDRGTPCFHEVSTDRGPPTWNPNPRRRPDFPYFFLRVADAFLCALVAERDGFSAKLRIACFTSTPAGTAMGLG